jgi:hypothetical protein
MTNEALKLVQSKADCGPISFVNIIVVGPKNQN